VAVSRGSSVFSVYRSQESNELPGDDPVEVTILNLFVMLVLTGIEVVKIVPFLFDAEFQPLQAVENSALVITVTFAGISKWPQGAVILLETMIGFLSRHFKNDDHESTHEEESICHLSLVSACVVEYSRVILAVHFVQFGQFTAVPVHHC
jgi:hypothetical protein